MKRPAVGRLRGKTRVGRLALWDALLVRLWPGEAADGVLEVGAGERVDTVAALVDAVDGEVTVVELHPRRAEMVRAAGLSVRVLERDGLAGEPLGVGVVRAANVLRQYPVDGVAAAHVGLGGWARDGGVVLEGSCDANGDVGAFHVLRVTAGGVRREGLVFFSSFARGFAPIQLRDWLPRDLRKTVRPDGAMGPFFAEWMRVWRETRAGVPAVDFRRSAAALGCSVVELGDVREGAAAMVWRPEGGVPAG